MRSTDLGRSLPSLFSELVHGAPEGGAFVLNPGDAGLLATLDELSAEAASRSSQGGGTIAAHVDHLRFALSLLNRWAEGENAHADADWTRSWEVGTVSETRWRELRHALRREVERWHSVLREPREVAGRELDGVIGSIVHLAYHMGAIRQVASDARGPRASESA